MVHAVCTTRMPNLKGKQPAFYGCSGLLLNWLVWLGRLLLRLTGEIMQVVPTASTPATSRFSPRYLCSMGERKPLVFPGYGSRLKGFLNEITKHLLAQPRSVPADNSVKIA
jgi:hypothetical protein